MLGVIYMARKTSYISALTRCLRCQLGFCKHMASFLPPANIVVPSRRDVECSVALGRTSHFTVCREVGWGGGGVRDGFGGLRVRIGHSLVPSLNVV